MRRSRRASSRITTLAALALVPLLLGSECNEAEELQYIVFGLSRPISEAQLNAAAVQVAFCRSLSLTVRVDDVVEAQTPDPEACETQQTVSLPDEGVTILADVELPTDPQRQSLGLTLTSTLDNALAPGRVRVDWEATFRYESDPYTETEPDPAVYVQFTKVIRYPDSDPGATASVGIGPAGGPIQPVALPTAGVFLDPAGDSFDLEASIGYSPTLPGNTTQQLWGLSSVQAIVASSNFVCRELDDGKPLSGGFLPPCHTGTAGDSCESDRQCGEGFGCRSFSCTPLGGLGAPCQDDSDCDGTLRCDDEAGECLVGLVMPEP